MPQQFFHLLDHLGFYRLRDVEVVFDSPIDEPQICLPRVHLSVAKLETFAGHGLLQNLFALADYISQDAMSET